MEFTDKISIEKYDEFVKNNKYSSIFQSSGWAKIKDTWEVKRVAIEHEGKVQATAQILIRKGLWYITRGPILDYENQDLLAYFLTNLKKYAKQHKAKLIKIDIPRLLKVAFEKEFPQEKEDPQKEKILQLFRKEKFKHCGFSKNMSSTIQPRFEAVSFLDEDFFDNLPKHTKRLIKDCQKRYVEVKRIYKENLDDLMFALTCTEERKNIILRKKSYFENLIDTYKDDCLIYTAYLDIEKALGKYTAEKREILKELDKTTEKMYKKKRTLEDRLRSVEKHIKNYSSILKDTNKKVHILASAISIKYGESSEMLYAGMNEEFKKIPAQYQVYVETMKDFYISGCKRTSMGGIEGTLDDSLLLFKSHFSPKIVEHYGEFDYTISKIYKLLYNYGLPIRRKILKLLSR